jgi:futalosine hydrolase
MLLLLVSATDFEISATTAWLNNYSKGFNSLKHKLLISGIGQLQTTYALQNKIRLERPDLVIQAGIGGATEKEEPAGVFAIGSDRMADLGVMEKTGFSDLFQMGLAEPDRFPFEQGKLKNPYRQLLNLTGLPVLDGMTVNEIKAADSPGFQRNPSSIVESMEGAALHYVCLMEKIPFLQIRAISNRLGDRDKSQWKMKEAIQNLNETLVNLIQKLEKADETLFRI